jgi:hypothetical protein
VTAVTTAGLLAGLFGSAFVPAARAGIVGAAAAAGDATVAIDDTSAGYDGTATVGGTVEYYAVAGKALKVNYDHNAAMTTNGPKASTAQTITVSVTNAVITAVTIPDPAALPGFIMNAAGTSFTVGVLVGNATPWVTLETLVVTMKPTTAGTGSKVSFTFTNSVPESKTISRTINIVAAAASGTASASKTTFAVAGALTEDATTKQWSGDHGSTSGVATITANNSYNAAVTTPTTKIVEVVSSNPAKVNVHVTTNSAPAYANSAGSGVAPLHTDATAKIGVFPEEGASGSVDLTIKVGGVVQAVKTYSINGPVASLTPTRTIQYVAAAGTLATGTATKNAFTLVAKDAAGRVVPLGGAMGTAATFKLDGITTNTVSVSTMAAAATPGYGQLPVAPCGTSDVGVTKSITASSTWTDYLDTVTTVTSPAWTITCTGASGIITNIAFDKASYLPSSAVKVVATATDSGGRPLGFGGALIDGSVTAQGADEFSITKQGTLTLADADGAGVGSAEGIDFTDWIDGVAEWTAVSHNATGDFGLVIAIADNDANAANAATPASFSLASTVSNILSSAVDGSLVAGAKKLKATATFGASAANKKIAFTLENTRTGVVKTYYRKANASGVASFTLRFGGSYEVTAAYGDYMTETVTLKK